MGDRHMTAKELERLLRLSTARLCPIHLRDYFSRERSKEDLSLHSAFVLMILVVELIYHTTGSMNPFFLCLRNSFAICFLFFSFFSLFFLRRQNDREGFLFLSSSLLLPAGSATPTDAELSQNFTAWVRGQLPSVTDADVSAIEALYPISAYPSANNTFERAQAVRAEWNFVCPSELVAEAFKGKGYKGRFSLSPSYHAEDEKVYFPSTKYVISLEISCRILTSLEPIEGIDHALFL